MARMSRFQFCYLDIKQYAHMPPANKIPHQFSYLALASPLPPVSLCLHSGGHLAEAGNVATSHQTGEFALCRLNVFLCGLEAVLEARLHDAFQLIVDFFRAPYNAL